MPIRQLDWVLTCSVLRAWVRLISDTSARLPGSSIFSDRKEIGAVRLLSENDAQAFVDVIDEVVSPALLPLKDGFVDSKDINLYSSARFWVNSLERSTGGIYGIRIEFVAGNPYFRNCSKLQIVITREIATKVLRISLASNLDRIRRVSHPKIVIFAGELTASGAEALQGSHDMEHSSSSKRVVAGRCDDERDAVCDGIEVDEEREHQHIRGTNANAKRLDLVRFSLVNFSFTAL